MLSWRLAPGALSRRVPFTCHTEVCFFFVVVVQSPRQIPAQLRHSRTLCIYSVFWAHVATARVSGTGNVQRSDSAIAYSMASRFEHVLRKLMEKYYVPDADRSNTAMHLILPSCRPNDSFMTRSRDRRMFGISSTFRTEHQRYTMASWYSCGEVMALWPGLVFCLNNLILKASLSLVFVRGLAEDMGAWCALFFRVW